ncbi:peptide chain release factor N(5)-glutamine methyltransferase [Neoehrlichia mikurensis]|uniref:peptide chain release factor N(5)-glutamine methyltransferase n=1 Tax=Neoehrlichia mikurensis TaxID=89586 RepID=A0A9Q9BTZ4_9RICK|nr:peptide chain release factor N(5)-glutamine methyltransferase [Neoehrlichia mikurensis]QXK92846.1 peptide chain release factor N(5)-glutamine methyltransferase [Neoehrlichia mikurensis]QXK93326.1 peptide chain release factor N(5)-glutamine methyltransferase [Neoehrlichia mikurensis]UTO55732.1 peptide chain release factor N(5)-glutamine methyltransferase [Neoehrlichia mikurensis]UTO56649.1 peptide chain release factor N(5)-glutamine methyltransferase [Neoehrlichia mikurensis]
MVTISSLLREAIKILCDANVDNPRFDAEVLMQYTLDIKLSTIIANPNLSVCCNKLGIFWQAIRQRANRVPVSQIIGKREFWDMEFMVNSNVLDPRPETETIISSVLKIYKNKNSRINIADLGAGTGCIIITLLSHYNNAVGVAFEKSVEAYRVAYKNLKYHKVYNRTRLFLSSWIKCKGVFDLIVSNPPYVKRSKIAALQPEVKLYEPFVALDGGSIGIENYIQIFQVIKRCLKKSGKAILEIGEDQSQIHKIVPNYKLIFCSYVYDLCGKKRCIILSNAGE